MRIDAIGQELTPQAEVTTKNSINQEEFIKLFLAQLRAQDPANATSNEEFLAQMAQFASLEQSRITNEGIESLNVLTATSQTTSLLGKQVSASGLFGDRETVVGKVTAVEYSANGPVVTINTPDTVIPRVSASQITLVREADVAPGAANNNEEADFDE